MTSLVAWVGADSRGPASMNIASDSRISWMVGRSVSHHWDQGKKIFASMAVPLIVGYVGDVLFPTLVLPGVIDRIDRQVFRTDGAAVEGLISAIRREWRDYPAEERRPLRIYIGHRIGEGMSSTFRLTQLSNHDGGINSWQITSRDTCLAHIKLSRDRWVRAASYQEGTGGLAGEQRKRYQSLHFQRVRRRGGRWRGPRLRRIAATCKPLPHQGRPSSRDHLREPAVLRRHASHRR